MLFGENKNKGIYGEVINTVKLGVGQVLYYHLLL